MGFGEAVKSALTQSVTWEGRARRSEYWFFILFSLIVYAVGFVIDMALPVPIFTILVGLALILPTLAVTVRRLHDTGRSGWWWWIGIVPIVGSIVLLVFTLLDSSPEDNNYGPSPKYAMS